MLCYKDRTYCDFKECKHKDTCSTYLTDKIKEDAHNFGLDVSVYANKPECFESNKGSE